MVLETDGRTSAASIAAATAPQPRRAPAWLSFPTVPIVLTAVLLGFLALDRVSSQPGLRWAFLGAAGLLAAWTAVLFVASRLRPRSFGVVLARPVPQHYVQGIVQICLYIYWGWHWRDVYAEAPLILGQFVFLYTFDALLTWTRGRDWRLGFGPLPIILSVNIFLWFKDDWYVFQFLMVATGALGKEFLRWEKEGRRVHIFNPSALPLSLFSLALLAAGATANTWAVKIAASIAYPPHMYLYIFALGLVVQSLFSVTLMTLSAVAALVVANAIYSGITGVYYFVFWNIPVPVFLGLHLLMTDPSTSPRTNVGKVIFGSLYGLSSFALYGILNHFHAPTVYDKLLPIPLLNLGIRWMDRVAGAGAFAGLRAWESRIGARKLNFVHMALWIALFAYLQGSGYIGSHHEGGTVEFWRRAVAEGKRGAGDGLVELLEFRASEGSGEAWNDLGLLHLEGKLVPRDPGRAQRAFARAAKLGDLGGSANLATMFLASEGAKGASDVQQAFDQLEAACVKGTVARHYYLVGYAYEVGRGRPKDREQAARFYDEGCKRGDRDACASLPRVRD